MFSRSTMSDDIDSSVTSVDENNRQRWASLGDTNCDNFEYHVDASRHSIIENGDGVDGVVARRRTSLLSRRAFIPRECEQRDREKDRQRGCIATCCTNLPFHVFWAWGITDRARLPKKNAHHCAPLVQVKMEPLLEAESEREAGKTQDCKRDWEGGTEGKRKTGGNEWDKKRQRERESARSLGTAARRML